jgi:hypothetical protein
MAINTEAMGSLPEYMKETFVGGKNQQFFEELRDRWNRSRIGSIALVV